MKESEVTIRSTHNLGFSSVLTLLFIALKLTGHIAWSWWWVLSPMWLTGLLIVVILVGVFILAVFTDKLE